MSKPTVTPNVVEVTFENVTVTIAAANPQAAYDRLTALLGAESGLEYSTDTFTITNKDTSKVIGERNRDTSELFPDDDAMGL